MITSIVAGFDGSDASDRAIRFACAIAKKFDAGLQISHTPRDETVQFAAEAISGFYVGTTEVQKDALRKAAEEMGQRAQAIAAEEGVTAVVHIGHSDPAQDVLHVADGAKADLIVTGRRGLGDLGGLVLGSTSHQISKRATCACATVP